MAVLIRLAGPDDAAAIAAIYEPYVSGTRITFEEVPPEAGEIAHRMANPVHPWLAAELDGRLVGYASTAPMRARAAYRWSVETGIYLASDVHGRGIGKTLLTSHLQLLECQGFVAAFAGIALPNDASVAIHKSLGFELMGVERGCGHKLGEWADVARFQRALAPRSTPPAELRAFVDVWSSLRG